MILVQVMTFDFAINHDRLVVWILESRCTRDFKCLKTKSFIEHGIP